MTDDELLALIQAKWHPGDSAELFADNLETLADLLDTNPDALVLWQAMLEAASG